MRTKTLLLTAALSAAGVASSMAQVYSDNIVGYINCNLGPGFNFVADQLKGSPDNNIATLFPDPALGTVVYWYDSALSTYKSDEYFGGGFWAGDSGGTQPIDPGVGIFYYNPTASSVPVTFVGEVKLSSSTPILHGFNLVSSVIPQSGDIDTVLNYIPGLNDVVYKYDNAAATYKSDEYFGGGFWAGDSGGAPVPGICEAVLIFNNGPNKTWDRTITVGP